MKINRLIIILALALLGPAAALTAQNINSPYSMFGYGQLKDNATSAQRQMGGVGYAMHSGRQVNVMNPAAYAGMDSLTFLFDMGLDFTYFDQKDNSGRAHDFGGGLDYITMQFPVARWMGVSIGLLPYSSVGYAFGNEIANGSSTHQGNGGFNQLYAGFGVTPFKGFRLGANISYLFGNTYNDIYATASTGGQSLFEQVMEVQDFHLLFGIQYSFNLNRRNRMTIGATYSPEKTLLGNTYVQQYDVDADKEPSRVDEQDLKGNYSLPTSIGAGISYEWNNALMVEADVTWQNWKKAKYKGFKNFSGATFDDRYRIALGASYMPDARGSFFRRMTYRIGGFYNRDYIKVNDNNVRDYGVSAGFGFPAINSKTVINLGFEYIHRQAHPEPLLKENYFNVTLGINFNQLWFFQSKIR